MILSFLILATWITLHFREYVRFVWISWTAYLIRGLNFFAGMMSFNAFDEYIPNQCMESETGIFLPSLILLHLPFYLTGRILLVCFVILLIENGEPWHGCPRQALKRVLKEAEAEFGGNMSLAFEQEAYLLNEVGGKLVSADNTHCFSIEGIQMQEKFLHEFVKAMEEAGVKIDKNIERVRAWTILKLT